jgi:flagellar biogenesis protein FliO
MAGRLIPAALVALLAIPFTGGGAMAQLAGGDSRAASSNPISVELPGASETAPAGVASPSPAHAGAAASPAQVKSAPKTPAKPIAAQAEDVARMQRVARRLAADAGESVADLESPRPAPSAAVVPGVGRAHTTQGQKVIAQAPQEALSLGQSVTGKPASEAPRASHATAGLLPAPIAPTAAPAGGAGRGALGGSSLLSGWMQTTAALVVVIALILSLRSVAMRWLGTPAAGRNAAIEVLARVPVAARQHVLLLRAGRRVLLVGDSPAGGLRTLADIDDPEEVGAILQSVAASRPQSVTQGFGQLLQRINGSYDDEQRLAMAEGGDEREFAVDSARDQVRKLLARVRGFARKGNGSP